MATCSNCRKRQARYRVKSSVLCQRCFRKTEQNYRTSGQVLNPLKHGRVNRNRDRQPNVRGLKGFRV